MQGSRTTGLQQFAENIWICDGPDAVDCGLTFTTRMTVVKLTDGCLWISSPVSVEPEILEEIIELGRIRYLVAATPRHVWRLSSWHALFPEAQLFMCRKTPATLLKGELPITGTLGDIPEEGWASDLDQLAFKGNSLIEEVVFFHKRSHVLILDDLIQSNPMLKGHPFRNLAFKLNGIAAPEGGVARDIRISFTSRKPARQSLNKLLSWDFDKLIIGHGACLDADAKAYVGKAFEWLTWRHTSIEDQ